MSLHRCEPGQRKPIERGPRFCAELVIGKWLVSETISRRNLAALLQMPAVQRRKRRALEQILQLQRMTVQTTGRAHQLPALLQNIRSRWSSHLLWFVRSAQEILFQLLRLLLRKVKVGHARPDITRFGREQIIG